MGFVSSFVQRFVNSLSQRMEDMSVVDPSLPSGKFLEWMDGQFYTDTACTTLATADGNNVKGAKDLSNGYNGTRSSTNPTYLTNQFGSRGGAYFNAKLPVVTGSVLGSSFDTAFTCFLVVRNRSSGLADGVLHSSDSLGHYLALDSHRQRFYTGANATTYYGPGEVYAPQILVQRYNGSSMKFWQKSQAMHGNVSTARTGNLGLTGAFGVGDIIATGFPWSGVLGHCTLYNTALTDNQVSDGISYLATRYGITERTKQVICWGDSLTYGQGAGLGSGYPEQVGTLLGSSWGIANCGFSSQTVSSMNTYKTYDIQPQYDSSKSKNIVIVWLGTNDINAGTSDATAYASYKSLASALQGYGFYVIAATIIKRSTFDASKETERGVFNTALMAETLVSSGGFNARIDPGSHASLQNTADATYYTDGTHLTAAGYAVIAGLANTAILAA
jgi:lysophospholipase L1-like esterase